MLMRALQPALTCCFLLGESMGSKPRKEFRVTPMICNRILNHLVGSEGTQVTPSLRWPHVGAELQVLASPLGGALPSQSFPLRDTFLATRTMISCQASTTFSGPPITLEGGCCDYPILQVKKPRLRELEWLFQDYTVLNQPGWGQNLPKASLKALTFGNMPVHSSEWLSYSYRVRPMKMPPGKARTF